MSVCVCVYMPSTKQDIKAVIDVHVVRHSPPCPLPLLHTFPPSVHPLSFCLSVHTIFGRSASQHTHISSAYLTIKMDLLRLVPIPICYVLIIPQ